MGSKKQRMSWNQIRLRNFWNPASSQTIIRADMHRLCREDKYLHSLKLVHTEGQQRLRTNLYFVDTNRLPLPLPLPSLNGSTTHSTDDVVAIGHHVNTSICLHITHSWRQNINFSVALAAPQCERAIRDGATKIKGFIEFIVKGKMKSYFFASSLATSSPPSVFTPYFF